MADERVFQVEAGQAVTAEPIDLAEAGFRERSDLQEWVLGHPEIIGEDVLVITSEFDYWESFDGQRQPHRLDVLGIDSESRLVLAELKRDKASDTVQLQAINYAALAATFTEDDIVDAYRRHLRSRGTELSEDEATARILSHCDLDTENLRRPRIVLIAGEFSAITLAAVDWLTEQGLNITLQRVQAYRIPIGAVVMTASQLYPLPTAEEIRVTPRRAHLQAKREQKTQRRAANVVSRLVRSGLLADGTRLVLKPNNDASADHCEIIRDFVAANPEKGQAVWHNNSSTPLEWVADGQNYAPTTVVRKIFEEATGTTQSHFRGPRWWCTPEGMTLPELIEDAESSKFDWTQLHEVLRVIPAGRWTTYGDLAAMVGTAAQPLGKHLADCEDCSNAWRVLDREGRPTPQFAWSDPARHETQSQALSKEGIRFDPVGRADGEQRLSAEELNELVETVDEKLEV